jgi:cell wall assembly regulator SMI1
MESVEGQVGDYGGVPMSLQLRYSRITDEGMEAFAGLTEVTEFESSMRMTDAALAHMRGMVKMEKLTLNEVSLTGDGLRHLAGMSRLEGLHLCSCALTDSALAHLPALPALKILNLTSSSGCTTAALECLTRLRGLTAFCLNGAPAAGWGLRHLASLPRLVALDLSSGSKRITTDADLAHLPPLPTVEQLDLRYTYVTDAGLAHLARLPAVDSLTLEMTEVTDAGIGHLAALSKLKWVNLNHTKVTIRGVRELQAAHPAIHVTAHNCTGDPAREPEIAALIRRPEYREAAPVARSWARIEAWFAEHLPDALASLRPPAKESDLDALEERIGRPLPADFRASYLIHDGQSEGPGVLFGARLEPIAEGEGVRWLYEHRVEHEWPERANWMLDWVYYPPDAVRETWSGPGWVPFYWDLGRNFIGIDLDPGPNGVVGQVIPFGTEDRFRPVLALSFAHLLEDIADELEAGNAVVRPPEVSYDLFNLKGGFNYKEWAEAKLPRAFQESKARPRFVPEDHATPVGDELAAEVLAVLRAFLAEMNAYERRWLAVRPIHEYGVSSVEECRDGIMGYWSRSPSPGERPANAVQEVLWDEKAMASEKHEALGEGKHYEQGLAEKREIWARFLTPGERPGDDWFRQQVPPYYDPAALTDYDVRQVAPGHAIVAYGQPCPPGTYGGTGRLRWHMRLGSDGWRIERHESVDDPSKPWKLELP